MLCYETRMSYDPVPWENWARVEQDPELRESMLGIASILKDVREIVSKLKRPSKEPPIIVNGKCTHPNIERCPWGNGPFYCQYCAGFFPTSPL